MIERLRDYLVSLDIDTKSIWSQDDSLLITAFTHKSYSADMPEKGIPFNERLEFLGDSILGAVVASWLYMHYPDLAESQLTLYKVYLVREATLAQVARKIDLWKYLRLWNGEERSGGRDKDAVLSDALEALIGYIYLDFWREAIEKFIQKYIISELDVSMMTPWKSFKSQLQEFVQKKRKEVPVYKDLELEVEKTGNVILYGAEVYVQGKLIAIGKWRSKKRAQEDGAEKALEILKNWNIETLKN